MKNLRLTFNQAVEQIVNFDLIIHNNNVDDLKAVCKIIWPNDNPPSGTDIYYSQSNEFSTGWINHSTKKPNVDVVLVSELYKLYLSRNKKQDQNQNQNVEFQSIQF